MSDNPAPLCPSAPPRPGALLLGRFVQDGSLAYAAKPLPVTASFLAAAGEVGDVGKRFRFASSCMQSACSRWQDGSCCVARAAAKAASQPEIENPQELPACVIRSECRWFAQEGAAACRICPNIVYDMETEKPTVAPALA